MYQGCVYCHGGDAWRRGGQEDGTDPLRDHACIGQRELKYIRTHADNEANRSVRRIKDVDAHSDKICSLLLSVLIAPVHSVSLYNPDRLISIKPNTIYVYQYEGDVSIQHTGVFQYKAKIFLRLIEELEEGFHCVVTIDDLKERFTGNSQYDQLPHETDLINTDEWFSVLISHHGEILRVYYSDDEDPEVVNIKKSLIGQLSARLHSSPKVTETNKKWIYQVAENTHEGNSTFNYVAMPHERGIQFTKALTSWNDSMMDRGHVKAIVYDQDIQIPHTIDTNEHLLTSLNMEQLSNIYSGETKRSAEPTSPDEDVIPGLPQTNLTSYARFELIETRPVSDEFNRDEIPDNLVEDDLLLKNVPEQWPHFPIEYVLDDIRGNLTCIHLDEKSDPLTTFTCWRHLKNMLNHLSDDSLSYVCDLYIPDVCDGEDQRKDALSIITLLGALSSYKSQLILTEKILLSGKPDPQLVGHTLLSIRRLKQRPPELLLETLGDMAWNSKLCVQDTACKDEDSGKIRAILTLGSIAKSLRNLKDPRSTEVVTSIETRLRLQGK
ncbi:uncharacterized protein [Ptychodera flava]|uniref:uncharacterized protein n=1 Tax=Ptychodera flava TaxID=63121 RepID=UPI00396A33E0